jgi:YD repeat-containing protein
LTALNGNTLAYDAEKRLKSVNGLGIGETIYYDATGQRVQKSLSSGSTAYVYDAFGTLVAEYANGTSWSRDYIRWGGGQLIATENASGLCTTCYFSYDHLGSVRLVTDANATVIGRHDYLP